MIHNTLAGSPGMGLGQYLGTFQIKFHAYITEAYYVVPEVLVSTIKK
jgi:hypothetical protein